MSEKRCVEQLWWISDKSWFYAAQSKGKVDKVDIEILSLGPKN